MTDEKKRPADPMTAQDGAKIMTAVGELNQTVSAFSNRIALIQGSQLQIIELLTRIDGSLSLNRAGRIEVELREAELEFDIAERQLNAIKEKLDLKKNVNNQTVDTQEKIRTASATIYADLERQKKDEEAKYWLDVRRSIIKAVLISLSVAGVSGAIAFIWWLFQFYLSSR